MKGKQQVLSIADTLQSANKNIFKQMDSRMADVSFTFTPRNNVKLTSADCDYISLERRRKYQYYEKK